MFKHSHQQNERGMHHACRHGKEHHHYMMVSGGRHEHCSKGRGHGCNDGFDGHKCHRHHMMASGQHGHGGRGRGHAGHDGFDGHGRSPLLRGRKFSADDLQLLLLHFLSEQPNYGYELIKIFGQRTNGFYTPSPGVIYPALTYLEEGEYIAVQMEGTRKRYTLTDLGKKHLADNQSIVEHILAKLDHFAKRMESVNEAISQDISHQPMTPELEKVLCQVRHSLHSCRTLPEEKQQQLVTILESTIKAIEQLNS